MSTTQNITTSDEPVSIGAAELPLPKTCDFTITMEGTHFKEFQKLIRTVADDHAYFIVEPDELQVLSLNRPRTHTTILRFLPRGFHQYHVPSTTILQLPPRSLKAVARIKTPAAKTPCSIQLRATDDDHYELAVVLGRDTPKTLQVPFDIVHDNEDNDFHLEAISRTRFFLTEQPRVTYSLRMLSLADVYSALGLKDVFDTTEVVISTVNGTLKFTPVKHGHYNREDVITGYIEIRPDLVRKTPPDADPITIAVDLEDAHKLWNYKPSRTATMPQERIQLHDLGIIVRRHFGWYELISVSVSCGDDDHLDETHPAYLANPPSRIVRLPRTAEWFTEHHLTMLQQGDTITLTAIVRLNENGTPIIQYYQPHDASTTTHD